MSFSEENMGRAEKKGEKNPNPCLKEEKSDRQTKLVYRGRGKEKSVLKCPEKEPKSHQREPATSLL